jgi:hypothetical protein
MVLSRYRVSGPVIRTLLREVSVDDRIIVDDVVYGP